MFEFPVSFRRRCARRSRMFGADVSGMRTRSAASIGAAIQTISHKLHRQLFAETANPAIRGPRAGPAHAAQTHQESVYGTYKSEYISWNVAPALARAGLPKNPWRNRKTSRPAKLSTSAVGNDSAKNRMKVM